MNAYKASKTNPTQSLGCLLLFAFPFALVGLGMAYLVVTDLWDWQRMRGWREVPAEVLSADLIENTGDDSTTYSVEARYRYEINGQTYTGDRVSLSTGSDNVGSFHQDVYRELQPYLSPDRLFRCFVDPDDPTAAILYRDLRWGMLGFMMIFVLAFGGVGFGLMYAARKAMGTREAELKLKQIYPNQPWRSKQEWADGHIYGGTKAEMFVACGFAAFWNLISTPLLFIIPSEVTEKGNYLALIGLLFPLIGVGLVAWAVIAVTRWRRFGRSVFIMEPMPGVVGGRLQGVITTAVDIKPQDGFQLTLSCIHKETRRTNKGSSTSERVLWQDQHVVQRERRYYDRTRSEVPVLFAIPFEAQATDDSGSSDEIIWRLEVAAQVPGVDYNCRFEVPVFKTEASAADFELDESEPVECPAVADLYAELKANGIILEPLPDGGTRLDFQMARNKGMALGVSLFALIWTSITVAMFVFEVMLIFPMVFGLFAVLMIYASLTLWFDASRIDIYPRSLTLCRGWFGGGKPVTLERGEVKSVEAKSGNQSGNRLYYNIQLKTFYDKAFMVATNIKGLQLAKRIIAQIEGDVE